MEGERRKVKLDRIFCSLKPLEGFTDEEGFHIPVLVKARILVDDNVTWYPVIAYTGKQPTIGMCFKDKDEWESYRDEFHDKLEKELVRLETANFRDVR